MKISAFGKKLGRSSAQELTKYFKATDIVIIDWKKINKYNERILDIFSKLNEIIADEFKLNEEQFAEFESQMMHAYKVLRRFQIIEKKFHNNGRAPEGVYYDWMRGYMVATYFRGVIAKTFSVDIDEVKQFGKDNLSEVAKTKGKTKKEKIDKAMTKFVKETDADFEIVDKDILIEVQAGFTGKNDIKKTKAEAAKESTGKTTYVFHFDFFNGKMAVVDITCALDLLPADRWKKNDSLNSAFTTPICDEKFIWKLDEAFPENVETLITKLQDE